MANAVLAAMRDGILRDEDFAYTIKNRPDEEPFLFRLSYTEHGEEKTLSIPSFALPFDPMICVHDGEYVRVENLYPDVAQDSVRICVAGTENNTNPVIYDVSNGGVELHCSGDQFHVENLFNAA